MNLNKASNESLAKVGGATAEVLQMIGKSAYWGGRKQSRLSYEEKREALIRALRELKAAERKKASALLKQQEG
jgi:hypothetical protein